MTIGIVERGALALLNFDRNLAGETPAESLPEGAEATAYWYRSREVLRSMREPLEALVTLAAPAPDPAAVARAILARVLEESWKERPATVAE